MYSCQDSTDMVILMLTIDKNAKSLICYLMNSFEVYHIHFLITRHLSSIFHLLLYNRCVIDAESCDSSRRRREASSSVIKELIDTASPIKNILEAVDVVYGDERM